MYRKRSCEACGCPQHFVIAKKGLTMAWDSSTEAELAAHPDWMAGTEEQKERFAWLLESVTSKH